MATNTQSPPHPVSGPLLIVVGLILLTIALVLAIIATDSLATAADGTQLQRLTWALVVSVGAMVLLVGLVFLSAGTIRWAVSGAAGAADVSRELNDIRATLGSINDRMLLSDTVKRIAFREKDRDVLRKAIEEDIQKKEFETAMVVVTQMSQAYGYRHEAEELREEINRARAAEMAQQVTQAVERFEEMLGNHEYERASAEAGKLQRLYPDSLHVKNLGQRVREVREQHKQDLERQFLMAAERDDVERAMDLLKELDKYLTEGEAEPFRETARGVIGKKRQNLGVQFKLAVSDREWTQSVRIGEQIIREFPNTRMADEVRSMLDLLRERAAGEQAARTRETA